MNIIFGHQLTEQLREKYTVLELDTFRIDGQDVTSYCLVENIGLMEIANIEQFSTLHANLIKNYKIRNWKFCEDALEHLMGKWNGELDSFYMEMASRVGQYRQHEPEPDWQPIILRS